MMREGDIIQNNNGQTGVLVKIEDDDGQYHDAMFKCSSENPKLHVAIRFPDHAVWSFNECQRLPVTGRTAKNGMR